MTRTIKGVLTRVTKTKTCDGARVVTGPCDNLAVGRESVLLAKVARNVAEHCKKRVVTHMRGDRLKKQRWDGDKITAGTHSYSGGAVLPTGVSSNDRSHLGSNPWCNGGEDRRGPVLMTIAKHRPSAVRHGRSTWRVATQEAFKSSNYKPLNLEHVRYEGRKDNA